MPVALNGSTSGSVTLTAPAVAGTNTLTLPAVTDTLVGLAATQTLTNKTLSSPTITGTPVGISGMLIRAPQVLTSGTSYTTPANCTAIIVEALGAGGSGTRNSSLAGAGTGGGGGGYVKKYFTVSASTAYSYVIGAGGAARTVNETAGLAGGDTTFTVNGTTITAGGGGGGANFTGTGAVGGTATNGDLNVVGERSSLGVTNSDLNTRGGAGSIYGYGGKYNSVTAQNFGAGGAATQNPTNSGAGSAGLIIISEYT